MLICAFIIFSVDGILLSRTVDPSELLMDLGFGGQEKSYMAKIPLRFFGETSVSYQNKNNIIFFKAGYKIVDVRVKFSNIISLDYLNFHRQRGSMSKIFLKNRTTKVTDPRAMVMLQIN